MQPVTKQILLQKNSPQHTRSTAQQNRSLYSQTKTTLPRKAKKPAKKADFLLSTDSLSGYGLDLIFQLAKEQ